MSAMNCGCDMTHVEKGVLKPHLCRECALLVETASPRQFEFTIVTAKIVREKNEPLFNISIVEESRSILQVDLNAVEAVKMALELGHLPEGLGLDKEGKDLTDGELSLD